MEDYTIGPPISDLLNAGVQAHAGGDYEAAVDFRQRAIRGIDMLDPRYPGVQSSLGLAYDRLGQMDEANVAATVGYNALHAQLCMTDTPESRRQQLAAERPTVELHLGIIRMRAAAALQADVDKYPEGHVFDPAIYANANRLIMDAVYHQAELRVGSTRPHQWDVNIARRQAAGMALDPTASTYGGLRLAGRAVWLGALSESPRYVDGTSGLGAKNRLRAKAKAVLGGMAAATLCTVKLVPGERADRQAAKLATSRAIL